MQPIDDAAYQALAEHFSVPQMIEVCLNVGLTQISNRLNATFLPDVDDYIAAANARAERLAGSCPLHHPPKPT
jgi:hypothetical protein